MTDSLFFKLFVISWVKCPEIKINMAKWSTSNKIVAAYPRNAHRYNLETIHSKANVWNYFLELVKMLYKMLKFQLPPRHCVIPRKKARQRNWNLILLCRKLAVNDWSQLTMKLRTFSHPYLVLFALVNSLLSCASMWD